MLQITKSSHASSFKGPKKEINRVPAHKRIKVYQRVIGYKVPLETLVITKSSHASSCKRPEKEINREVP